MRLIGIDFGDARIGIATSDINEILATAQGFLKVDGMNDAVKKTVEKIKELNGEKIVHGLPKNMDGSSSFRVERTKKFANQLKDVTGLEIIFFDERLSTMEAYRYLNATDYKSSKRKNVIDALSAQIILQAYLDSKK